MNRLMKTVFLCPAAMFGGLAMAQTAQPQPLVAKSSSSVSILLGPAWPCPDTTPPTLVCRVPVAVTTGDGCQVTVRSPIQLARNQLVTRIVWTLSVPSSSTDPANTTYSFQPDHGILVLNDSGQQIVGRGLGDGGSILDFTYHVDHRRNANYDVTYLPVVLRTVPPTPPSVDPLITLCGASDPKIVNN